MTTGDWIALSGVIVAIIAILATYAITSMAAVWQKDLDTLQQLANHLTDWHSELVNLGAIDDASQREWPVSVFLTKRYDVPYN